MRSEYERMKAPDPFLSKMMGLNQGIIDWHTGTGNVPKDIYKHPTIASKLPVYEMAKRNMDAGRIGRGVAGSTNMGKSQYAEQLGMEDDFNRSIAASGQLEQSLRGELDSAQKNAMGLYQLQDSRNTTAMNMMDSLYKFDDAIAKKPSGWGGFFKGLAGGALNILGPMAMAAI